jgi:hypothetical protein
VHPGTAHQDSATHTRRDQEDDDGGQQGGGAEALDAAAVACDAGEGHGEVRGHAQNSSRLGANTGILENALHVFSRIDDDDDHYVVSDSLFFAAIGTVARAKSHRVLIQVHLKEVLIMSHYKEVRVFLDDAPRGDSCSRWSSPSVYTKNTATRFLLSHSVLL